MDRRWSGSVPWRLRSRIFWKKGTFEPPAPNEVLQDAKVVDLAFAKQLDPDVKDSVGIDAVREIKNFLWQRPNASTKRTLIIDDAELLTDEAQNALLKVTEEPPASSLLIVVAYDIESLMPTILSRLQKIYFGAVPEAKKALGKPGLEWRLANDEELIGRLELAQKFLKTPAATQREFIKKLIAPDEFKLRTFLEAVIMVLAREKPRGAKAELWHRTLKLYESASNFGLNPRLQLESLLMNA
jgi:DNA polymerase III delta prime subunit